MSVHPSNRLPAAAGDALSSPAADTAGGGDAFNSLVTGLVTPAAAAPADGDGDAETPAVEAADPGQAGPKQIPESVEQLLALVGASRTHAAGKAKGTPSEPEAKQKDADGGGTNDPGLPTPPALAAAATPAASPAAVPTAPTVLLQSAASRVTIAAARTPAPKVLAALPAAAPAAAAIPASTPSAPTQPASATPPAEAQPAAATDPLPADPGPTPQAVPAQAQPAAAAAQATAPAANDPASAAIRSLLAELGAPAERRRSDRPAEAATPLPASAALRPADQPATLGAAPAPLAPAHTQTMTQAAAPAAPLQGLVIERQLDLAHQQDWIDQLARDISSAAGGDGGALRFRLNPEHLGTLHVEIAQSHHGAAVRFSADSEAARAILADAQPRLVAEARAQGVRISEAHVDLGSGGTGDPRRQPAAPADVPIRTARSLQEEPTSRAGGGKPTRGPRELYA